MRPKFGPLVLSVALCLSCTPIKVAAKLHGKRLPPQQNVRVVSVTEDSAGNFVLLTVTQRQQLPFPKINYLPGPDGQTIMAADFAGTILCAPQSTLRFSTSPVKQMHVGQLQASPPVVRICLQSRESAFLKRVDFRSAPGSLIIKLPNERPARHVLSERQAPLRTLESVQTRGTLKEAKQPADVPPARQKGSGSNAGDTSLKAGSASGSGEPAVLRGKLPVAQPQISSQPGTAAIKPSQKLAKAPTSIEPAKKTPAASSAETMPAIAPDRKGLAYAPPVEPVPTVAPTKRAVASASLPEAPPSAPDFSKTMPLTKQTSDPNAPRLRGPIELATAPAVSTATQSRQVIKSGDATYTQVGQKTPTAPIKSDSPSTAKLHQSTDAIVSPVRSNKPASATPTALMPAPPMVARASEIPLPTILQPASAPSLSRSTKSSTVKTSAPGQLALAAPAAESSSPASSPRAAEPLAKPAGNEAAPIAESEEKNGKKRHGGGFRNRLKRLLGLSDDTPAVEDTSNPQPAPPLAQQQQPLPAAKQAKQVFPQITQAPAKRAPLSRTQNARVAAPSKPRVVNGVTADGSPLQIQVTGSDPLNIRILTNRPVQTNTFRLHDPERYVIDLTGLDEFDAESISPEVSENPWVKSVRVGRPETEAGKITRIALDLYTSDISIAEVIEPDGKTASFTLQHDEAQTAMKTGVPVPTRSTQGMTVVLDAGHGGSDPGAQRGDVQEKELTMSIVDKLRKQLQAKGIKVRLTRQDDSFVSLEDRVRITNTVNPDAFVSVHINAMETNTGTQGIETYFQNDRSRDLAQLIHQSLVKETGAPDRSIRKARFYVINHTPLPAILAEVGFISNKDERDKLTSSDYQAHIASALADGVMLYLSEHGQGRAVGTISSLPPSAPQQSFTQNLHSRKPPESNHKVTETSTKRRISALGPREKVKTKVARQSLKFNRNHLASTRG